MTNWLDLTKEQKLWTITHRNLEIANSPEDISCPWCNTKQCLEYENVNYEDGSSENRECIECSKVFSIETCVNYDWRTELPEEYLIEEAKKIIPTTIEENT